MADLTVTLSPETEAALARLAQATNRSRDEIVADALAEILQHEYRIAAAILRGRADVDAGRTTPHDEVMRRMDTIIRGAQRQR